MCVIGACAVVLTRTSRVTCPAGRCRARGTLRTKEICPRRLRLLLLLLARALVLVLVLVPVLVQVLVVLLLMMVLPV